MEWDFLFIVNSLLLGAGLSMDAFSVSLANGLNEPEMEKKKICGIAGVFAFFQAMMPMLGWICVHMMLQYFRTFEKYIPWIALVLLIYIGGKMLAEGIKKEDSRIEKQKLGISVLLMQGVATSIDALSVGFTIAEYGLGMAIVCVLMIAAVTFIICIAGIIIGKKFGTRFSNKASVLGGIILMMIGIEIFLTGVC